MYTTTMINDNSSVYDGVLYLLWYKIYIAMGFNNRILRVMHGREFSEYNFCIASI